MHQKRLPLPAPSAKGIVTPTRFALRAHPTISLTLMVPPFTWTRASTPLGGTKTFAPSCSIGQRHVPPTRFALRAHPTISLTLMVPPFTWTRASTPLGGTKTFAPSCSIGQRHVPPTRFALRAHPTISLTLMVPPFTWTRASTPLGGTMPLTSCCHLKTSQVLATTVAGMIFLPDLRRFSAFQRFPRRRSAIFVTPATLLLHTCSTSRTPATLLLHTCDTSRTPATLLLTPAALRAHLRQHAAKKPG